MIRDLVGLAENQWDFTKPDGVPGFGLLELTEDLRRIAASVFGDTQELAPPPPCVNAEQNGQVAEMFPEPSPAATAPTRIGSDAEDKRPNAANRVATSTTNPEESLPVRPQDGRNNIAGQPSATERDQPMSAHGGARARTHSVWLLSPAHSLWLLTPDPIRAKF